MPSAPAMETTTTARAAARLPVARWTALVALLFGELIVLMLRFDTDSLRRADQGWWADELWHWKIVLPPLAIAIVTAAVLVGGDRLRDEVGRAARDARGSRTWPFLLAHLAAFAIFERFTAAILEGGFATAAVRWTWIVAWLATALATLALWTLTAWPPRVVGALVRRTSALFMTAVVVGAAAWAAGLVTETWWDPLRASTIAVVGALVRRIASDPVVDAPSLLVGTSRFSVRILSECAGYEGIGLIWVFLGAYLWLFRRELRFPHALLLIPIGTVAVWLANALRLTGLIAIGTWLSPDVALGGFHTYSGSLLFSAIALALAFGARRSRVFTRIEPPVRDATATDDAAPAYLLPFLAILGVSMVTGALTAGGFDPLYPLRVVVAAALLWTFRRRYRALRWTVSWSAVAYGAAAFALWMALEPYAEPADRGAIAAGLRALPIGVAAAWVALRVVGSVITVPIAEELAFRGFVLRRFVDADFERVPLRHWSWLAFVASSLLFGAMHSRLLAGTLAGMLYALALRRRGELADPIVAHATTNALIAAWVLVTGEWSLWA